MWKRLSIWIAVVVMGVGVALTLRHLKQVERQQEGIVTYHAGSGDLLHFFIHEMREYDGVIALTNRTLELAAEWRYAEDPNGFQILLPQSYRDDLVRTFTEAFGEPLLRDEYPHLVYKEDRFGVGVVADLKSDPIHIICIRKGVL